MGSPPAAPQHLTEEVRGDVTFVRTDPNLPPVAIIDRSPITTRHRLTFGAIAVLGAVAWAMIAFLRGETVNAVWFVLAAICTYVIGLRTVVAITPANRFSARRSTGACATGTPR